MSIQATAERIIIAQGARRRVVSLMCVGWSARRIAAAAGCTAELVQSVADSSVQALPLDVHDAIARAFDRLGAQPIPVNPDIELVRWARMRGGVPPLAWDDEDIDDPKGKPDRKPYRPAYRALDKLDALEEFNAWGMTYDEVGFRWGMRGDSVYTMLNRITKDEGAPEEKRALAHRLIREFHARVPNPAGFQPEDADEFS